MTLSDQLISHTIVIYDSVCLKPNALFQTLQNNCFDYALVVLLQLYKNICMPTCRAPSWHAKRKLAFNGRDSSMITSLHFLTAATFLAFVQCIMRTHNHPLDYSIQSFVNYCRNYDLQWSTLVHTRFKRRPIHILTFSSSFRSLQSAFYRRMIPSCLK